MRPKSLALLLLALGCGLVASIGITRVMARWNTDSDRTAGDGTTVVVAATDIGMGDLLTPEMLKSDAWPKDKTPAGAITDIKEIEGRRTRARLYVGEPILESRLFAKGTSQQGASAMITKGYRIVSVKVDLASGGSGLILPGDRVDVMAHFVRDPAREIKETITRTILQDVKVFAVNDVVNVEKEGSKSINAKTVSLLVTPKQASIVMLAGHLGDVSLVMRSPEAEEHVENAEARTEDLFGEVVKRPAGDDDTDRPPPVEPPKAKEPVVVAAAPTEKAKARPTWTIRVIKPNGVDDVVMEQEPTSDPGLALWKTVAPTGVSADVPPIKEPQPPSSVQPPNPNDAGPLGPLVSPPSP